MGSPIPPSVLAKDTPEYPQTLEGIVTKLREVYPLQGYRQCANERQMDRYHGAQDVIDVLSSWQAASEK